MTIEFGQRYKWYKHDILIHKLGVTWMILGMHSSQFLSNLTKSPVLT
jgi:hypothetical protein